MSGFEWNAVTPFYCCGKKFMSEEALERHIRKVHEEEAGYMGKMKYPKYCILCYQLFHTINPHNHRCDDCLTDGDGKDLNRYRFLHSATRRVIRR